MEFFKKDMVTTSIRPYGNKDIETATNQVVIDDPGDDVVFTTGNVYIDHRYDIRAVAIKCNCDMNTATWLWENKYFKKNKIPEKSMKSIVDQRRQWLKGMANISLCSRFTLADMF